MLNTAVWQRAQCGSGFSVQRKLRQEGVSVVDAASVCCCVIFRCIMGSIRGSRWGDVYVWAMGMMTDVSEVDGRFGHCSISFVWFVLIKWDTLLLQHFTPKRRLIQMEMPNRKCYILKMELFLWGCGSWCWNTDGKDVCLNPRSSKLPRLGP